MKVKSFVGIQSCLVIINARLQLTFLGKIVVHMIQVTSSVEKLMWTVEADTFLEGPKPALQMLSLAAPPELKNLRRGVVVSVLGKMDDQVAYLQDWGVTSARVS